LALRQNNYKFEGKERDTETDNDDFGARYYSNRLCRWQVAQALRLEASRVAYPLRFCFLQRVGSSSL
jgi:RHS repeat-associated protein